MGVQCPNPYSCGYFHDEEQKKYVFGRVNAENEQSKEFVSEQQRIEARKLERASFGIAHTVSSDSSKYTPPVFNRNPGGNPGPGDKFNDSHRAQDGLRRPMPVVTDVLSSLARR